MSKEAQARIKIDNLLKNSGWLLADDGKNKANVSLETYTKPDSNNEESKHKFADYVL